MGMKSIGALFVLLLIVTGMWGCSQQGNLIVQNKTATDFQGRIESKDVTIGKGMDYKADVYIGKSLLIVGPKDIDVTVTGSSWTKRLFVDKVNVSSGSTTTYTVKSDVGACDFSNEYHLTINAVQVKPCASDTFGPNLLEARQTLEPGEHTLLQLDPGCWDIRVNYGKEELLNIKDSLLVEIGKIDTLKWKP